MLCDYQPYLPIDSPVAADRIRKDSKLDWFHRIDVSGFVTPGYQFDEHWRFVADFLSRNAELVSGAEVLEPGCADGLWTCWLTKLGARHVHATDVADRTQFRLVSEAFGLPATYYPGLISSATPSKVKRQFDLVCSLGVLYHLHDPLVALVMYRRYLRNGGRLILETGSVQSSAAYLQYTGASQVYGREGGNQFLPSIGFLRSALNELGMVIIGLDFHTENMVDECGNEVGRVILAAEKSGGAKMHYYSSVLDLLGMTGPEFAKEEWYQYVV